MGSAFRRPPLLAWLPLLAILTVLQPRAAYSEEALPIPARIQRQFVEMNGDLPIAEIRISGLVRTRRSVIEPYINARPGMKLSDFDPVRLIQDMRHTGIFKTVNINYSAINGGALITIELEEKWTLLPIPVAVRTRDTQSYGLFLYESNALGYNKRVFAGAMYTNFGWNGMAGFFSPGMRDNGFVMSAMARFGDKTFESMDMPGNLHQRYRARYQDYTLWAGYQFFHRLTVSAQGRYRDYEVRERGDDMNPPSSSRSATPGFRFQYRDLHYIGFSNEGIDVIADVMRGYSLDGERWFHESRVRGKMALAVTPEHFLVLMLNGGAGGIPEAIYERIGGKPGFKTLRPEEIASDRYWSASPQYEFAICPCSWGTVTGVAFYEAGQCRILNSMEFFHGPGGGVRIYLRNIAFPAFGFDYAWNVVTGNSEFSASIGYSM